MWLYMLFVDSGKLVLPCNLALNYGNITHAGPVSDIADVLQNVCELDLSKNKITQWTEVYLFHIGSECT